VRVGSFGRIRSKEEAVAKCAKTTEVVDCKGHEMDILSNKIGKNIGPGATDGKLLLLVLVVLGRSGNHDGRSTRSTRRRRRDSNINS
jgi:hypothetical protein